MTQQKGNDKALKKSLKSTDSPMKKQGKKE